MWTWKKIYKLIVFTIIIQYVSIGQGQENGPPSTEPSATTLPTIFMIPKNQFKPEQSDPNYRYGLDRRTTRPEGPPLFLSSTTARPNANGNIFCKFPPAAFLGKRVRISAMLKSENLTNWGGIGMAAIAGDGKWLRFDTTSNQLLGGATNRPIHGTTDWTQVTIVTDIPSQTSVLGIGLQLKGSGMLCMDEPKIEVVGEDVPTTDDQNPHLYSDYSPKYSMAMDRTTLRDAHPVLCVTSHAPPPGAHCWFGLDDRQPDQYLGHRIRLSAWVKCEGNGRAHLSLVAAMPGRQSDREIDNQAGQPAFPLTENWRRYEVIGNVPANAQCLTEGDFLWCNGRVWIDDMKVEIIDH